MRLPAGARPRSSRRPPPRSSPRPTVARHRRSRARSSPSAKKRAIAAASAAGSPGGDEEPVLAVAHDLGHATDRRRDDGAADRERLDDRVREVLPGRREHGRVGRAEQPEHLLPRHAAEERDAPVESELTGATLEGGALGPVAGDRERHAGNVDERLQRDAEGLLRPEATGEDERRSRRARARRAARHVTAAPGAPAPGSGARRPAPGRAPSRSATSRR